MHNICKQNRKSKYGDDVVYLTDDVKCQLRQRVSLCLFNINLR